MAVNGAVPKARAEGRGPTIWLAGTPDELEPLMPLGIAGIVTNTVVLNQYAKQYGSAIDLIKALSRHNRQTRGHGNRRSHSRRIARGWEGIY